MTFWGGQGRVWGWMITRSCAGIMADANFGEPHQARIRALPRYGVVGLPAAADTAEFHADAGVAGGQNRDVVVHREGQDEGDGTNERHGRALDEVAEYADESVNQHVKHTQVSEWAGDKLETFLTGLGYVSVDALVKPGAVLSDLGDVRLTVLMAAPSPNVIPTEGRNPKTFPTRPQ